MTVTPEPKVTLHADHDPGLTCRPALGHSSLCEVLEQGSEEEEGEELA